MDVVLLKDYSGYGTRDDGDGNYYVAPAGTRGRVVRSWWVESGEPQAPGTVMQSIRLHRAWRATREPAAEETVGVTVDLALGAGLFAAT